MPHPLMFDERDPYLGRLRDLCTALPACVEKVAHGRPTFRAGEKGRVFVYYGGSVKQSAGPHERHDHALIIKPDPGEAQALEDDPRFWVPAYLGPAGWRGIDLDDAALDWTEVAELVDASYRQVAGPRLVAELDAGDGSSTPR